MLEDSSGIVNAMWRIVRGALRPGDSLSNGRVIQSVERLQGGDRYVVTISPEPLQVIVEVPRPGNAYTGEGAGLGIWVDSHAGRHEGYPHEPLCRELADRLTAAAGRTDADAPRPTRLANGPKPILYLVPGHLGDPEDVSIRTLQVLSAVSIIFVELDKAEEVRALLARFNVRPADGVGAAEIVEIDGPHETRALERWRATVEAGLDACLFGANEGIPGFCDPGKQLVIAASQMSDRVDIRSVGGSSVLGHALMRIPADFGAFEFAGLLYSDDDVSRVSEASASGRLPVVMFSHGRAVRAHLCAVLERGGVRQGTVHLLAAITSDQERSFRIDVARFAAPSLEELPDHRATVVVIEPDLSPTHARPI